MTKEDIQKEYSQLIPQLGEKVYRAFVPYLELLEMGRRCLFLNNEMGRIRAEEAECQRKENEKKASQPSLSVVPPDGSQSTPVK